MCLYLSADYSVELKYTINIFFKIQLKLCKLREKSLSVYFAVGLKYATNIYIKMQRDLTAKRKKHL